jgi:hypothetical protein
MKTVYGDLVKLAIAGNFDVIVHGCNCYHTMGAGIAKQIKKNYQQHMKQIVKQLKVQISSEKLVLPLLIAMDMSCLL